MSVTTVGALPYPTMPPPRFAPSAEAQAGKSNVPSSYGGAAPDATGRSPDAFASSSADAATNHDADTEANPLPPPQAATAPGTDQKVNVIA